MRDENIEKQKKIILESSKNSLFYKNAKKQDLICINRLNKMKQILENTSDAQYKVAEENVIRTLNELEVKRNFNKIYCVLGHCHFLISMFKFIIIEILDMDMFYAAVEIRDKPELIDKPVAVGGESIFALINYIA